MIFTGNLSLLDNNLRLSEKMIVMFVINCSQAEKLLVIKIQAVVWLLAHSGHG